MTIVTYEEIQNRKTKRWAARIDRAFFASMCLANAAYLLLNTPSGLLAMAYIFAAAYSVFKGIQVICVGCR